MIDKTSSRAGCGPRAVVWRTLLKVNGPELHTFMSCRYTK